MTESPREVLRRADTIRSRAQHAEEVARLSKPSVGLGVKTGTYAWYPDEIAIARAALEQAAQQWHAEADALEATLTVKS